ANGMRFTALDAAGAALAERIYYSAGGGFVVDPHGAPADVGLPAEQLSVPHPFDSAAELLRQAAEHGMGISSLMLENERSHRSEAEIRRGILVACAGMDACVKRGGELEGILPGGLKVKRRAAGLYRKIKSDPAGSS